MTLEWTDWFLPKDGPDQDFPGSPYVNWWISRRPTDAQQESSDGDKLVQPIERGKQVLEKRIDPRHTEPLKREKRNTPDTLAASSASKYQAEFPIKYLPIREDALNEPLWMEIAANEMEENDKQDLPLQGPPAGFEVPKLDRNSVIVGIIDRGIPLNHARLCDANGTRILASWQIDADWEPARQAHVPFGREVYKNDIDDALNSTSGDEAFNERLGLVDMQSRNRANDVMYRQSHGAAILDRAAGAAPDAPPENIWVIVVNLPSRASIGSSGGFLDYFASLAAQRLQLLADWLWLSLFPNEPIVDGGGFPVVMNLSFGKNAGPQSSDDFFHKAIEGIRKDRPRQAPFIPVIAAGNDNLEEGHAKQRVPPHILNPDPVVQGWWVQPEDQSPSFLEVWSEPIDNKYLEATSTDEKETIPFTFDVLQPGVDRSELRNSEPKIDHIRLLNRGGTQDEHSKNLFGEAPFAAIAVRKFAEPGAFGFSRLQFTICVLPTVDHQPGADVVPSGEWRIEITNLTPAQVTFDFMVQTDEPDGRSTRTSQRSWLTDAAYRRHDETGRVADSYSYPGLESTHLDPSTVKRHGTLNSTAVGKGFIAVAGHREMDGRPAAYSSTGARNAQNRHVPDVSFPNEDGAAHRGVLASGSKDGSVLPIGGTSMAAAMATRRLSLEISALKSGGEEHILDFDPEEWLRVQVGPEDPFVVSALARPKLGWGRLTPAPDPSRVTRLDTSRQNWPEPTGRR